MNDAGDITDGSISVVEGDVIIYGNQWCKADEGSVADANGDTLDFGLAYVIEADGEGTLIAGSIIAAKGDTVFYDGTSWCFLYEKGFNLVKAGSGTVANINGLSAPYAGLSYYITGAHGTLTLGNLAVEDEWTVMFTGDEWVVVTSDTVSNINDIDYPVAGLTYKLTNAGTITVCESLTVTIGDVIMFNGKEWVLVYPSDVDVLHFGGSETSVNLEAMTIPTKNKVYIISSIATSATVGSLTTAVGDLVLHNGTSWVFLHNLSDVL